MSPSQSQAGRAFEYAVVCALRAVIGNSGITLQENSCSQIAAKDFLSFPRNIQQSSILSAEAAIRQLLSFEPYLQAAIAGTESLAVRMQPDWYATHFLYQIKIQTAVAKRIRLNSAGVF